jgi:hypothetical protein
MTIDFSTWQRKTLTTDVLPESPAKGGLINRSANGVVVTALVDPIVDPVEMTAFAVINTTAIDYEGEVILPEGVMLGNYANNPVVMWDHGKEISLPIGISQSPTGELDIYRGQDRIEARTYFAKSFAFAGQIFALIDERVIRATSIGVIPIQIAEYVSPAGQTVPVTERSNMVEYSWCPIGVNPEAVSSGQKSLFPDWLSEAASLQVDRAIDVLNRGSLGGDRLLPAIRKSLAAMVPKPKGLLIKPFDTEEDEMPKDTLTAREVKKMTLAQLKSMDMSKYDDQVKAMVEKAMYDMEAKEKACVDGKCDTPAGDSDVNMQTKAIVPPAEEVEEEDDEDEGEVEGGETEASEEVEEAVEETVNEKSVSDGMEGSPMKLGARILTEMFDAIAYMKDYFEGQMGPLENDSVRTGASELLIQLGDMADAARGLFETAYPELPSLGSEEEVDEDSEMAAQMKSLLAASQTKQFQTLGIKSLISAIGKSTNLTATQRRSISAIESKITRLVKSASDFVAPVPEGYVPVAELEAANARLAKAMQVIDKIEAQVLPAS